jgi:hypothetical protein
MLTKSLISCVIERATMTATEVTIKLKRYGHRAYHVIIDGQHWGNVCGYEDPRGEGTMTWTAVWFTHPDSPDRIGGRRRNVLTRREAVAEVKIETSPNRR